jgi:hypothetical protein
MDEFTMDAFVNREGPISAVILEDDLSDDQEESTQDDVAYKVGNRGRLKIHTFHLKDNLRKAGGKASEAGTSVQDRLLEKLLQQVIPVEDLSKNRDHSSSNSSTYFVERPNFNITTMSNNFRRFNARIGVVFVFQARMIRLELEDMVAYTVFLSSLHIRLSRSIPLIRSSPGRTASCNFDTLIRCSTPRCTNNSIIRTP